MRGALSTWAAMPASFGVRGALGVGLALSRVSGPSANLSFSSNSRGARGAATARGESYKIKCFFSSPGFGAPMRTLRNDCWQVQPC